jgi:ribosomal-protein-alanine N-acetyltransferase
LPPELLNLSLVPYHLLQLMATELEALAASRIPEVLKGQIEEGALPPAFVAARALALMSAGHLPPWATTFLIVDEEWSRIVGGCGFKSAPIDGMVEIGYGIAPKARGRGAATSVVAMLVAAAFAHGAEVVLAEVSPTNTSSTRVMQKAGFERVGVRVDDDKELVVQWVKRKLNPVLAVLPGARNGE